VLDITALFFAKGNPSQFANLRLLFLIELIFEFTVVVNALGPVSISSISRNENHRI